MKTLDDYCSTRKLGNTHLVLTGRHLYVSEVGGWIMDKHIEKYLSDCYEILTVSFNDSHYNYHIIMRSTEAAR